MALQDIITDPRFQNADPEDQSAILKQFGASDEFVNKFIDLGIRTPAQQSAITANEDILAGNEAMAGAGVPFEPVMTTGDAASTARAEAALAGTVPLGAAVAGIRTLPAAGSLALQLGKGMVGGAAGEKLGGLVGHPTIGSMLGFAAGSGISRTAMARKIMNALTGRGGGKAPTLPPSPPAGASSSGAGLTPEAEAAVRNFQAPRVSTQPPPRVPTVAAPPSPLVEEFGQDPIAALVKKGFTRQQAEAVVAKYEAARVPAAAPAIAGPLAESPNVKPATTSGPVLTGAPPELGPGGGMNPAQVSLEDLLRLSIERAKLAKAAKKAAELLKAQGEGVVTP